jgi:iron(III) transport system ATP-binding protein
LSNLDARLRDHVRSHLHELHARLGFTAVFVTHDQSEALSLGDRLAIMRSGAIEQLDRPELIFQLPATEYVAGFIGMGNRIVLEQAEGAWRCGTATVIGAPPPLRGSPPWIAARVRSEDLVVTAPDQGPKPNCLSLDGIVADAAFAGRHYDVVVSVGDGRFQGRALMDGPEGAAPRLAAGNRVGIVVQAQNIAFFGRDGMRLEPAGPGLGLARIRA